MIDFTEILSYILVLFGFIIMVIVARYRRDVFEDERMNISISETAKDIPVAQIDSPYRIKIEECQSSLTDGVYIRLYTKIRCQLRAYWFVNIQNFYTELDSSDFRMSLVENRFLKHNSVHEEIYDFETSGDFVQRIQFIDAENYLTKNNTTRREYPLVIIVHSYTDDNTQDFFQLPIQVASLHVKSSLTNDPPTKFLMKISKLANGQSLVLQDIFTSGGFSSEDTCSICLTERVNHVLLPCKHACLCQNCFSLMDKCPICQKLVLSYFKI